MINVGDIIRLRRKDYTILSIFSDPNESPNKLFYTARTTLGRYPSYCVLTEDSEGKLFVHI